MNLQLLITTTFMWSAIPPLGYSILTMEPADVVTQPGSTVVLPCYTNLSKPVMWELERAGGESIQWLTVYQGAPGEIQYRFKPRYNVLVDVANKQYNLTITDVQPQDAGTYRCGDNMGLALRDFQAGVPGSGATAELVVIIDNYNQLKCEQNIDGHQFLEGHVSITDLRPDLISVNCSLHYRGNVAPTLEWSLVLDTKSNKDHVISLDNYAKERVMSNFEGNSTLFSAIQLLPAGLLHNSRVRCKVAGPVKSKSATDDLKAVVNVNLPWTSKKIQVMYISLGSSVKSGIEGKVIHPYLQNGNRTSLNDVLLSNSTCSTVTNIPCLLYKAPQEDSSDTLRSSSAQTSPVNILCSSSAQTSPVNITTILIIVVLAVILAGLVTYILLTKLRVNRKTPSDVHFERGKLLPENETNVTTTHDINSEKINGVRGKFIVAIGKFGGGQFLISLAWNPSYGFHLNGAERLPEVPAGSAICLVNNVLYVVGIGKGFNELWKWSASSHEWTRCAYMPSGRRKHCVTSLDGNKIYVLGGWSEANEKSLDSVLCYDINSETWNEVGYLSKAVHDAACTTYGTLIFVFGGCDSGRPLKDVQIYGTLDNFCSSADDKNQMPERYSLMRAVTVGNQAILIGQHTCYLYNFDSNEWQERERFHTNVEHFGLTFADNVLYMSSSMSSSSETSSESSINEEDSELRLLPVDDFMSDNEAGKWSHHSTLPATMLVQCSTPLYNFDFFSSHPNPRTFS